MSEKKEIISASPKVRKLAREFGADIFKIQGSQREGRVTEEDVKSFIKDEISGKIEKKQTIISEIYDHSEFGEIDIKPLSRSKKIAKLCKDLKIDKKELFGGSITISSLGSIGGSFFTPIINQPEVAILGIGRAEKKQVFVRDKYESKIMLPLSLSYDHRVIDGAEGARFCAHLRESLGKDFAYKLAV